MAPVATERYVWSANPKTGRVALIDSQTYQVQTVVAGASPTFISAIPGAGDRAIVLNVLSNDATLLTREPSGISQKTFQVAERANAWAISSDAHWAIAWTDVTQVKNPDKIDGFQTISIIDLTDPNAPAAAVRRTVGFRPSSISFADSPPRAFAVTEDGISIVDLAGGPEVKRIPFDSPQDRAPDAGLGTDASASDAPLTDDDAGDGADAGAAQVSDAGSNDRDVSLAVDAGNTDSGTRYAADAARESAAPQPGQSNKVDVSITPKGDYAVVRRQGSAVVTLIELATSSRVSWTLSGPVTDLDLSDIGDRAVAVVRDQGVVAVLPVPKGGITSLRVEGQTFGSVVIAPGGETAILYTNAIAVPQLTVLDLTALLAPRTIDLHAPVPCSAYEW